MEKKEPLYPAGRKVNWYSHYGKQNGGSSKKLRIKLSCDPTFPLLGIYPKEIKPLCQRNICTVTPNAALLITAKIW